jgi:hypothetical protein
MVFNILRVTNDSVLKKSIERVLFVFFLLVKKIEF